MITSTSNAQVRHLVQLQGKAKTRRENSVFVVEGHKMVGEAPKDRIVKVYASETFALNNKTYMEGLAVEYELVADHVFAQMSDTKTPQGILAIVRQKQYTMEHLITGSSPLVVALENIQDPGNMGTIVRTAEGAGVSGVLMSGNCVDIYNPKTIRSTMGSIFRVPFFYAEDFYEDLSGLKAHDVRLYAAHLEGSTEYTTMDYRGKTAFLIGNEGNGLTSQAAAMADARIRISMCGNVESLNAAIATSVLLFEAKRQRDCK